MTPFDHDCVRKRRAAMEYRDQAARRKTCRCGIIKRFHWEETESGRCAGFKAMSLEEWATWVGYEGEV